MKGSSPLLPLYIPLLIFLARITDVSIATVRTILTINGHRWIAAALGFVEITIWALALGGVVAYLSNPAVLVAYAGGFATGTLVGLWIEERIALGFRTVQIMNNNPEIHVSQELRHHGFRVTRLDGAGQEGSVEVALLVVRRRAMPELRRLIQEIAPRAFVSVERADRPSGEMMIRQSSRVWGWTRNARTMLGK